jgi:hypothetical protein
MQGLIELIGRLGPEHLGWALAAGLVVRIVMQARESVQAQTRNTETLVAIVNERRDRDKELAEINARISQIATVLFERLPTRHRP